MPSCEDAKKKNESITSLVRHCKGNIKLEPKNAYSKIHTVLPSRNAAVAPNVAPRESATNPTGRPKR